MSRRLLRIDSGEIDPRFDSVHCDREIAVYFTAVNPKKRCSSVTYWPRKAWPWAANWEENHFRTGHPWNGNGVARGIRIRHQSIRVFSPRNCQNGNATWDAYLSVDSAHESQSVSYAAFVAPIPSEATCVRMFGLSKRGIENRSGRSR